MTQKYRTAVWHFRREQDEDGAKTTLEIDLGNDYALTITAREGDEPNTVTIWTGSGEHEFVEGPEAFAMWLEDSIVEPCARTKYNGVMMDAIGLLNRVVYPAIATAIERDTPASI